MSRRAKIGAAIVVLLMAGGVAAFMVFGAQGATAEVETVTVERADLSVTVTASGEVEAGARADVLPPVAGILAEVRVREGQTVSRGEVVAVMETGPLELAVAQGRAALAQAESALAGVDDQAPTGADVAAAAAATDAAWAAYRSAVAAAGAVSGQLPTRADRDAAAAATQAAEAAIDLSGQQAAADAAVKQAHAAYLGAKAQQDKLEGVNLSQPRNAARRGVEQARQALALAEANLAGAVLVAPIGGVVLFNPLGAPGADGTAPKAAPDALVAPQAPPFTIVGLDGLRFAAEVDEVDVDLIKEGMTAIVRLDAFAEQSFESSVTAVIPAATMTLTGGTIFPVHIPLNGLEERVLIGMKGDATIEVSRREAVTRIPIEALFDEAGETFVYVVEDDRLVRSSVEVGTLTEISAEIVAGVAPGAVVALSSAVEFEDGMTVRVR